MNKPYKWGIKEYVLNSSKTFYIFKSEVYLLKDENKIDHYIPHVVFGLIRGIVRK